MSTTYPTSKDSTVTPGSKLSSNPHSTLHIDDRDAIRSVQDKLGTGTTSQQAANRAFLIGTGAGASKWETAPTGVSLTTPTIVTSLDMNGTELILDADADTSITADTDDQIDFRLSGADDFRMVANVFRSLSGSSIETDTIAETTGGNGVTIDGLSVKDAKLNTDGSVIPSNLLTGTGSTWAWASWTPTLTNLSGGTQNYAKYIQIGKTVFFRFKYTLGGAGVSGNVSFSVPVTASAEYTGGNDPIGTCNFLDVGTEGYTGVVVLTNTTTANVRVFGTGGTYATYSTGISAPVPHTWANNDVIFAVGSYEAA